MTQFYSDTGRESEPHALPDTETFWHDGKNTIFDNGEESHYGMMVGWYWWPCFPGCLPDGEPHGPFDSEAAAIGDARSEDFKSQS